MKRRAIKFRVWNNKTKSWVHGPGQEPHLFGETILLGGFMQGVPLLDLDDCVPLQFTGLLDKNGVEIYEGDVINAEFLGIDFHTKKAEYIPITGREVFFSAGSFKCKPMEQLGLLCKIEVVGNIYENPELL